MLQQLLELLIRAVAAIAGIAVITSTELQQLMVLLLRAQSCGRSWSLPLLTI